jgi:predicted Zn-dependent peptidase
MSKIQTTTLDNGLRIITDSVPDVHSVAVGLWADVGTRDEDMRHNGVAHMVEHMLFKGTKNRNAQQIAEVIENVGGHMNAYTSRELTSYHVHVLKDDAPLALEVLADMYQHSTLPQDEVERERQVILQEIGMCNDTPDDLVFDNYYETAYAGQAVGAPILGRSEIIENMTQDILQAHITKFYTPRDTVISAAGNVQHDAVVEQVQKLFTALPASQERDSAAARYTGGEMRVEKDLEQAHFVLGFEGVGRLDDEYYAAQTLATLFGGGMSSRLFQEVREKRGLVYSVYSFHSAQKDSGQFAIYAGTGPDKLAEIVPVVCEEITRLAGTLTQEEVTRAAAQLKASMLMGRESMMTRADQQAKHLIFRGDSLDPDEIIKRVNKVDIAALQNVAQRIFASKPTLSALGPVATL